MWQAQKGPSHTWNRGKFSYVGGGRDGVDGRGRGRGMERGEEGVGIEEG
jgi:hypothetical protein